jgi:hypothetical protein
VTYAGAHDRDEVGPVNWILHREWVMARDVHPLSARRAATTKIALEDVEAPSNSNHLRLALGVTVGALLAAGTLVASSFGSTSEDVTSAAPVPEHVFASLEQRLSVPDPATDAPAPTPAPAPAPTPAPAPVYEQQHQQTTPAATEPQSDGAATGGGENQRTAPSAYPPAPAPTPPQYQQWGSGGQWGSGTQWNYGSQWGSGTQQNYNQWGGGTQQWRPVSGFGAPTTSSYAAATSTPAGPAMSTLNPFCDLMGH